MAGQCQSSRHFYAAFKRLRTTRQSFSLLLSFETWKSTHLLNNQSRPLKKFNASWHFVYFEQAHISTNNIICKISNSKVVFLRGSAARPPTTKKNKLVCYLILYIVHLQPFYTNWNLNIKIFLPIELTPLCSALVKLSKVEVNWSIGQLVKFRCKHEPKVWVWIFLGCCLGKETKKQSFRKFSRDNSWQALKPISKAPWHLIIPSLIDKSERCFIS